MNRKQRIFVEEYLQTWNASEAARRAGYSEKTAYSIGWELLRKPEIAEAIRRRVADLTVGTDEGLVLLTAQARASIAPLFKIAERWTEAPRVTDEIVEETMGADEKGNPVRLYRVRCIVFDVAKLLETQYGALVRKFKDSPKEGMTIEMYDAQAAVVKLLEAQGAFKQSATAHLNIDMNKLDDGQLERVAAGEDPLKVLISASGNSISAGAS